MRLQICRFRYSVAEINRFPWLDGCYNSIIQSRWNRLLFIVHFVCKFCVEVEVSSVLRNMWPTNTVILDVYVLDLHLKWNKIYSKIMGNHFYSTVELWLGNQSLNWVIPIGGLRISHVYWTLEESLPCSVRASFHNYNLWMYTKISNHQS